MMGVAGSDFTPPWSVSSGLTTHYGLLLWEFIRHTGKHSEVLDRVSGNL
jgi:hypothetical protein